MVNVELTTLRNGFRVVTDRMDSLSSAAVGVWVLAGGRCENDQQTGISHFLEHMAFKGTRRRTAFDIANAIESVGGYINAYTSREVTAYFARVLEEDVPLAVEIVADILREPTLSPEDVEVERGVILQEIGRALDTPEDVVQDWLFDVAYPNQPFGRSILGPAELVSTLNDRDLRSYMNGLYRPESMILSAAGAVDHAAVVAQAKELFGDLDTPATACKAQEAIYSGGERREDKDLEQVHLTLALEGPDNLDAERYSVRAFCGVLGGSMSSRLFQEARERRGLCYGIYANCSNFQDTGLLMIYSGTGDSQAAELASVVVDEMRRLSEDATQEETDRIKTQLRSSLVMGLESPMSRCERMASSVAVHGRPISQEETLADIDAVNRKRMQEAGEGLLKGSGLSYALYGKVAGAPAVAELQERLSA